MKQVKLFGLISVLLVSALAAVACGSSSEPGDAARADGSSNSGVQKDTGAPEPDAMTDEARPIPALLLSENPPIGRNAGNFSN